MYLMFLHYSIYVILFWIATVSCLKLKKQSDEKKKTLVSTPIKYEPEPQMMETNRLQKIAENRAKMTKKSENEDKNSKTGELEEDVTQPASSVTSLYKLDTSGEEQKPKKAAVIQTAAQEKPVEDLIEKYSKTQEETKNETKTTDAPQSGEEGLGEVQLIEKIPNADANKHIIHKKAFELAKRKQTEDAVRKQKERENLNVSDWASPDDSLKNISSIQFESQLSMIQRKRRQMILKSSEECTLLEIKPDELYIPEIPRKLAD